MAASKFSVTYSDSKQSSEAIEKAKKRNKKRKNKNLIFSSWSLLLSLRLFLPFVAFCVDVSVSFCLFVCCFFFTNTQNSKNLIFLYFFF